MATHPSEEAAVRAFIVSARRERYLSLLANPKKRRELLNKLNHCRDFDSRYVTALASTDDAAEVLRSHHASATCHVLSDNKAFDGRDLRLEDAVREAESLEWGSLLCCAPAHLAYYVGENQEQRLVLRR